MERAISLLREKNSYLEQFFLVNEHELINLGAGDFDNIEAFYQAREKILELIRCIDQMMNEESHRMSTGIVTAGIKVEAEELLQSKDEWVESILAQDLQILAYIDREKSNIIRELRSTNKARRAVGAYRSHDFVNQLNEKV